jgi:hypothetical protein
LVQYVIDECTFKEFELTRDDGKSNKPIEKYFGTYKCLGSAEIGVARFEIYKKPTVDQGYTYLYHNGNNFQGSVIGIFCIQYLL